MLVLKGLVASPCTGHGIVDVEIHDDAGCDMGECEGVHQVRIAVELFNYILMQDYVSNPLSCVYGWNQHITCLSP